MPSSDHLPGRRAFGGVLLVPVQIADQTVTMLVDTGAAFTTLTPRAATRLGLDLSGFARRVSIFTAAGATIELR